MIDELATVVDRLQAATNAHDIDAIVDCFSGTYRNETPIHPRRGFIGQAQVRSNWQHILAAVPDVIAEVTRQVVDDATVWSEWEMRGTRVDGQPHLMRGVIIFGVDNEAIEWARFYLEPVDDDDGEGAEGAVRRIVGSA